MTEIGYHCSHEQFAPALLRDYVCMAEKAGFQAAMSSDHLAPWSCRQGHSAQSWAWLGAAMEATKTIPFGSLAVPGGWRHHPVVIAQAFATLCDMYPGRCPWVAAGSGEAMNEAMVGAGWPERETRNQRLLAGVEIMRALWRGETVTRSDAPPYADQARLWGLPRQLPAIYAAALSTQTAAWAGAWADGLITVRRPLHEIKDIIAAFRDNGGEDKPLVLQFQLSWARDEDEARQNAHHPVAPCRRRHTQGND